MGPALMACGRSGRMRYAVGMSVLVLWQAVALGAGQTQTVSLTGDPAPGTATGVSFSNFGVPVLNDAGQVAFFSFLTGDGVDSSNSSGLWGGAPGSLGLVARRGSPAPGTPEGVIFSSPGNPLLNNAGEVAFSSVLSGEGVSSTNDRGIWLGGGGHLGMVARKGDQAPGTPTDVTFRFVGAPLLNNAGQVVFRGELSGIDVASSTDEGIWLGGSGSVSLVVREGDPAPGTSDGVRFVSLTSAPAFEGIVLNSAGQVAFRSTLFGPGVSSSNDRGIWRGGPGSLNLVARRGSPAPGTGVNFQTPDDPVLNDAGEVAFFATLTGAGVDTTNNHGIWAGAPGSLSLVARRGGPAPGTEASFSTLRPLAGIYPVLNDAGQVAFTADLTGSGVDSSNNRGIWRGGPESLSLVARTGAPAPGTGPGVSFSSLRFLPQLNAAGQVAFELMLRELG